MFTKLQYKYILYLKYSQEKRKQNVLRMLLKTFTKNKTRIKCLFFLIYFLFKKKQKNKNQIL